jgi:hypothetical protein
MSQSEYGGVVFDTDYESDFSLETDWQISILRQDIAASISIHKRTYQNS